MNPVEINNFLLRGYPTYLRFIRRRWKVRGRGEKDFYNQYDFHLPGMKVTQEFGNFIKENY